MTMPLPTLSEQNAIVDYLPGQRHRLDTLTPVFEVSVLDELEHLGA